MAARADERTQHIADCFLRAREGDREALNAVVSLLTPTLWHVARAEGLTAEDAVDVVQTTWLELLRHMREVRSPSALTAWLITTARREAQRMSRRQRQRAQADPEALEALPDPGAGQAELAELAEQQRALWHHFRTLPQRCQALLRVVATVERPDYEQVAAALGMPRGSIGPTRGRCLAKLRELLLADPSWSPR